MGANFSEIDMCCKNSYVVKKNEFDIGQYQKEIEEQKLNGKSKDIPQKAKRNKEFLDKHIKESNSKIITNEPGQHIRQKLEEYVKTAKKLILKVVNSSSSLGKGTIIEINAQGVEGSLRNCKDGVSYFGYLPDHLIKEACLVDFNIPIKVTADDNVDQKNLGRHFQIEFKTDRLMYYIRDLGIGYGTFIRLEYPLVLKDNHLINIGETFIVANIVAEKTEGSTSDLASYIKTQLRLKIFGISNSGETFYFPIEKKTIALGRQANCDIVIQDKLLSKIHSVISYSEKSGWLLMDGYENSASTNGTWLYINEDFEVYDKMIFKSNQTIFQVVIFINIVFLFGMKSFRYIN